jgi:hypothetical protein
MTYWQLRNTSIITAGSCVRRVLLDDSSALLLSPRICQLY